MFKKVFVSFLLAFVLYLSVASNPEKTHLVVEPKDNKWVDSVFTNLTPDERLGQLFMVAAYSNQHEAHYRDIEALVNKYHIGGLVFFQGSPVKQAQLTNRFQAAAKVPLLIAMDAEWGLGMRLDSTISYPKQMTLGAINNNDYVYKMGAEIARQFKRLGVHVNFAPVVDINSNPNNPVIGVRSFGEDKENVAAKGVAYMLGMQHNGVMANAKHFPGHGDTEADSHVALPVINHSKQRMSELELYPFKKLIADSLMSIMVGHLHVPIYDNTKNQPTSLSEKVVTDLLRNELGFKGLVFTDALNMKGVNKYHKSGDIDVVALLAGNDVLVMSEDVPEAIKKIKKAVKSKDIKQADVDAKVKKILKAKYRAGLHTVAPIELSELYADLNSPKAQLVKYQLYEQAMTVVKTKNNLVPFQVLDTATFASLSVNLPANNEFQETLNKYAPFQHYNLTDNTSETEYERLVDRLQNFKTVVVSVHGMNNSATKSFGISQQARTLIERLKSKTEVVVVVFGNPYSLKYFDRVEHLICAYEDNEITRQIAPQVLFGAIPATGKLPVSSATAFKVGMGISAPSLKRLSYSIPESVGMNATYLKEIDYIIEEAIKARSMPGCQILVAKNGKVVFEKAYGHLIYDSLEPVSKNTLYDLASVTKVAATLQAIMFLHERQLLDVNQKASLYLPELKGTNKENMLVRDILMHQAGLIAFVPYWEKTRMKTGLNPTYYSIAQNPAFPLEIAPGVYGMAALKDSLWKWTINSRLLHKSPKETQYNYVYSDLSFIMLHRLAERLLNQPIESFMEQNFYLPLGLERLTFNPLCKFPETAVAPTEQDRYFRGCLIRGTVHDQGAAMMGGVSGHAGLFGNANNLAILMQMNLQKGYYGGRRYFLEPTIPTFTKSYNKANRRGLGWDKPRPEGGGLVSDFASRNSFGHTGFTGTATWVDPEEELVYVFLSNRVYPSAANEKLMKTEVRRRVHDVIYKSIINFQALNTSITRPDQATIKTE